MVRHPYADFKMGYSILPFLILGPDWLRGSADLQLLSSAILRILPNHCFWELLRRADVLCLIIFVALLQGEWQFPRLFNCNSSWKACGFILALPRLSCVEVSISPPVNWDCCDYTLMKPVVSPIHRTLLVRVCLGGFWHLASVLFQELNCVIVWMCVMFEFALWFPFWFHCIGFDLGWGRVSFFNVYVCKCRERECSMRSENLSICKFNMADFQMFIIEYKCTKW